MAAVPSVFSLEPPALNSSQVSLVHFALPLPEPRVSGCKQNFVHLPFKRLSASLCLPGRQNPDAFHSHVLYGFLSWFSGCKLGSPAWGLDPTFLRGNPLATEISFQHFSCHQWEHRQPSDASSALPFSLIVGKWFLHAVCGYKASSPASVQLVIQDDFFTI